MKYSIRGNLTISDGAEVVELLNKYTLWRLETMQTEENFVFEAWVNNSTDKYHLFSELKPFVDQYGELIDWHECSHDELTGRPCVIAEEYRAV